MKKSIYYTVMVLSVIHSIASADVEVNFNGVLVEEPCMLDPQDSALELDMGTVITKMLYTHRRTPGKPFALHLLECDLSLGNTVNITFMGDEDGEQPGLVALEPSSTAEGLALGIETLENELMPINKSSNDQHLHSGDNTIELMYYISANKNAIENKKIKPGTLVYVLPFTLEYN